MDTTSMTLEGFFLSDYQRLRSENEELRAKVASLNDGYGITDLGHPTECVKVGVSGYNYYSTSHDGITSHALREVLSMEDDDLWRWAGKKYRNTKTSWYSPLQPVKVEVHKFQYTLKAVESRSEAIFVTDAKPNDDESTLYLLKEWEGEECLEVWQSMTQFEYVKQQALEKLREVIDRAIDLVEKQEREEGSK